MHLHIELKLSSFQAFFPLIIMSHIYSETIWFYWQALHGHGMQKSLPITIKEMKGPSVVLGTQTLLLSPVEELQR